MKAVKISAEVKEQGQFMCVIKKKKNVNVSQCTVFELSDEE